MVELCTKATYPPSATTRGVGRGLATLAPSTLPVGVWRGRDNEVMLSCFGPGGRAVEAFPGWGPAMGNAARPYPGAALIGLGPVRPAGRPPVRPQMETAAEMASWRAALPRPPTECFVVVPRMKSTAMAELSAGFGQKPSMPFYSPIGGLGALS